MKTRRELRIGKPNSSFQESIETAIKIPSFFPVRAIEGRRLTFRQRKKKIIIKLKTYLGAGFSCAVCVIESCDICEWLSSLLPLPWNPSDLWTSHCPFIAIVQNPGKVLINSQMLQFLLCWENLAFALLFLLLATERFPSKFALLDNKKNLGCHGKRLEQAEHFYSGNQEMCFEAVQEGPGGDLCF